MSVEPKRSPDASHSTRFGMPALVALGAFAAAPGTLAGQATLFDPAGGVRGVALNGAGVALVGDAGAVFTNPAGIATIRHIGLEAGYGGATGGPSVFSGAFAWRLSQFDVGGGVRRTTTGAGGTETLGVGTLIYRFGFLAFGGSAKAARGSTAGATADGVSADFGFAIAVFDIMALGFAVQNVGGNWGGSVAMPHVTRLGFTMNYVDPLESFRLLSTMELQWHDGRGMRAVLGLEGGVVVGGIGVVGRAGYGSRPNGLARPRLTYGGTLNVSHVRFDVAYEPAVAGATPGTAHVGLRLTL